MLHLYCWGVVTGIMLSASSIPNKEMLGRSFCCLCISGTGGHWEDFGPRLSPLC